MLGKQKCRMLKEIRQRIADENDIPYVTQECSFQGECRGTCPRCESELRYLEQQLALRASLGKRVAVAALCTGMALSTAGCSPIRKLFEPVQTTGIVEAVDVIETTAEPQPEPLEGEIAWPDEPDEGQYPDLMGEVAFAEPQQDA